MNQNNFLTIAELIRKYGTPDATIRRHIRNLNLKDPEKYKQEVQEETTYYGKVYRVNEDWFIDEFKFSYQNEPKEPTLRLSETDYSSNQPLISETPKQELKTDEDKEFYKEMIRNQQKQIDDYSKKVDEFLIRYGEINILLRDLQKKLEAPKGKPEEYIISESDKNNKDDEVGEEKEEVNSKKTRNV